MGGGWTIEFTKPCNKRGEGLYPPQILLQLELLHEQCGDFIAPVRDLILVDMSDIFLSAGHISVLLGSVSFSQTTYLSRLVSIVCGRICDISTFRLIFRTFSYNLNINQLRALGWIFDFSSNSECQNSKSHFTFCFLKRTRRARHFGVPEVRIGSRSSENEAKTYFRTLKPSRSCMVAM